MKKTVKVNSKISPLTLQNLENLFNKQSKAYLDTITTTITSPISPDFKEKTRKDGVLTRRISKTIRNLSFNSNILTKTALSNSPIKSKHVNDKKKASSSIDFLNMIGLKTINQLSVNNTNSTTVNKGIKITKLTLSNFISPQNRKNSKINTHFLSKKLVLPSENHIFNMKQTAVQIPKLSKINKLSMNINADSDLSNSKRTKNVRFSFNTNSEVDNESSKKTLLSLFNQNSKLKEISSRRLSLNYEQQVQPTQPSQPSQSSQNKQINQISQNNTNFTNENKLILKGKSNIDKFSLLTSNSINKKLKNKTETKFKSINTTTIDIPKSPQKIVKKELNEQESGVNRENKRRITIKDIINQTKAYKEYRNSQIFKITDFKRKSSSNISITEQNEESIRQRKESKFSLDENLNLLEEEMYNNDLATRQINEVIDNMTDNEIQSNKNSISKLFVSHKKIKVFQNPLYKMREHKYNYRRLFKLQSVNPEKEDNTLKNTFVIKGHLSKHKVNSDNESENNFASSSSSRSDENKQYRKSSKSIKNIINQKNKQFRKKESIYDNYCKKRNSTIDQNQNDSDTSIKYKDMIIDRDYLIKKSNKHFNTMIQSQVKESDYKLKLRNNNIYKIFKTGVVSMYMDFVEYKEILEAEDIRYTLSDSKLKILNSFKESLLSSYFDTFLINNRFSLRESNYIHSNTLYDNYDINKNDKMKCISKLSIHTNSKLVSLVKIAFNNKCLTNDYLRSLIYRDFDIKMFNNEEHNEILVKNRHKHSVYPMRRQFTYNSNPHDDHREDHYTNKTFINKSSIKMNNNSNLTKKNEEGESFVRIKKKLSKKNSIYMNNKNEKKAIQLIKLKDFDINVLKDIPKTYFNPIKYEKKKLIAERSKIQIRKLPKAAFDKQNVTVHQPLNKDMIIGKTNQMKHEMISNMNDTEKLKFYIIQNDIEKFKEAFNKGERKVERIDKNGDSLLNIATKSNSTKIALFLIDEGANINTQNNQHVTPLHNALYNRNYIIADYLRYKRVNEDIKNDKGMTPWDLIL